MGVELRWGSATDTGRVRDLNEDSLLVTDRLFAVADGMGGHAAGEVASLIAVETLRAASSGSCTVCSTRAMAWSSISSVRPSLQMR